MSELKIGNNQNYGLKEHARYTRFLQENASLLRNFLKRTGVIYSDFLIADGVATLDTRQPTATPYLAVTAVNGGRSFLIDVGMAVDAELRIINNPTQLSYVPTRNLSSSGDTLCVRHNFTNIEQGTLTVRASGIVEGVGTDFTSVIRPQNDNPTILRFFNAETGAPATNSGDLIVTDISGPETMTLLGSSFIEEANLRYVVVGSFESGIILSENDPRRNIYNYDHSDFFLAEGTGVNSLDNLNNIPLAVLRGALGSYSTTDARRFASITNA